MAFGVFPVLESILYMSAASSCILIPSFSTTHGRSRFSYSLSLLYDFPCGAYSLLGAKKVLFIREHQVATKSSIGNVLV